MQIKIKSILSDIKIYLIYIQNITDLSDKFNNFVWFNGLNFLFFK